MSKTITRKALMVLLSFAMVLCMMPVVTGEVYADSMGVTIGQIIGSSIAYTNEARYWSYGDGWDVSQGDIITSGQNIITTDDGNIYVDGPWSYGSSYTTTGMYYVNSIDGKNIYIKQVLAIASGGWQTKAFLAYSEQPSSDNVLENAMNDTDNNNVELEMDWQQSAVCRRNDNITLNLNGYTLSSEGEWDDATLTQSGSGTLTVKGNSDSNGNSGSIKSGYGYAVYAQNGTVELKGGHYAGNNVDCAADAGQGNISIGTGDYDADTYFKNLPDINYLEGSCWAVDNNDSTWRYVVNNGFGEYYDGGSAAATFATTNSVKALAVRAISGTVKLKQSKINSLSGLQAVKIATGMGATTSAGSEEKASQAYITDGSGKTIIKAEAVGAQLRYTADNATIKSAADGKVDLRMMYKFILPSGVDMTANTTNWDWNVKYSGTALNGFDNNYLYNSETGEYISNAVISNIPFAYAGTDFNSYLTLNFTYDGVNYTIEQESPMTRNVTNLVQYYCNNKDTIFGDNTSASSYIESIASSVGATW